MDLQEKVALRKTQLEEQIEALAQLKLNVSDSGHSSSEVKKVLDALESNPEKLNPAWKEAELSAVGNLKSADINIPPSQSEAVDSSSLQNKSFAYILGDSSHAQAEGLVGVTEEKVLDDFSSRRDERSSSNSSLYSLKPILLLGDDAHALNRPIHAIRFHPKYDDLLISGHGASTTDSDDYSGVINLWGLDGGDSRIQRTLHSDSPITSVTVPSVSPTTIFGGTNSGEVFAWDLRARASTPMQRAGSLSTDPNFSHSCEPVYSLEVPNGNSSELVSASVNGTVCIWSLSSLEKPKTKFDLRNNSLTATIRVTALGVPNVTKFASTSRDHSSLTHLYAGGEDGGVYRFDFNSGTWSLGTEISGHEAPVTSLSVHPLSRKWPNLNNLVISSSMDWTIRLSSAGPSTRVSSIQHYGTDVPGIISDVKWSPSHPCVFAAADEHGFVSLFDAEQLAPRGGLHSSQYSFADAPGKSTDKAAISRLQWSKDGGYLVAGDINGNLCLWRSSPSLGDPSAQEWERMSEFIKEVSK